MIKYVTIPERQETIAILNGTEFDAVFKIDKMLESIGASIYDYKKCRICDIIRSSGAAS